MSIPQLDGINDNLTPVHSAISSPGVNSGQGSKNFNYNYSLNIQNQTSRLVQNASKPPFTITQNSFKNVDGVEYVTNVNIQCSSGVYLTAIKPILNYVNIGWKTEVGDWTITCNKLSNRNDIQQQHLLCTQVSLLLLNRAHPEICHETTLHFYHTKDKIQIQGSSIMSPGVSSATWLSQNLIEPLAASHIASNQERISAMNEAILAKSSFSCNSCSSAIDRNSAHVRDQPLTCRKCSKVFHKRCTNKRAVRGGNWQKDPWYCPNCILAPHLQTSASGTKRKANSDTTVAAKRPAPQFEDEAIVDLTSDQRSIQLNSEAPEFLPQLSFSSRTTEATSILTPKFPSNSIRQRSSNIAATDPEREFEKTALDSCRSTIAIQETELKRLKESMDIRNKQIMQLEGQIGHATSYISSRTSDAHALSSGSNLTRTTDVESALQDSLKSVHSKLDLLAKAASSPVNNININNGQPWRQAKANLLDKSAQADLPCEDCKLSSNPSDGLTNHIDSHTGNRSSSQSSPPPSNLAENIQPSRETLETILTCTVCAITLATSDQLDSHMEADHGLVSETYMCDYCDSVLRTENELEEHIGQSHQSKSKHTCEVCSTAFKSIEHLLEHTETSHNILEPLKCSRCDYKCKTKSHLNYHMAACHKEVSADKPSASTPSDNDHSQPL